MTRFIIIAWLGFQMVLAQELRAAEFAEDFSFVIPPGFEGLLELESIPTELLYLDKTIDEGEIILSGQGNSKYYRSHDSELVIGETYQCASNELIRNIINDKNLCNKMSFSIHEKYEDKVRLVYLQPDKLSVLAMNTHFGINPDHEASIPKRQHIGRSSVEALSGSFRYNANFTEGDNSNGSLSLPTQVSYAEYLIEAEPIIDRYNGHNSFNVGTLVGSRTYAGAKHEVGFKPSGQNNLIGTNIGIIPNQNMVGTWYSSTNETFKDKLQGSGLPLQIFMPFTGMIEVYRGGRLLYVTQAESGMVQIPTNNLPIGVYDVSIVRRSLSGEELEKITDTVSNSLTNNGFTFGLGMMNSGERQANVLEGDYDDFTVGITYQTKLTDVTTSSVSLLNVGENQYFQSVVGYQSSSPFGANLSTEFDVQSTDWGMDLQTSYTGMFLDQMVNSHFSYRFSDLEGLATNSYFLNASLMPNHWYSKLFMINAHASTTSGTRYNELNIENQSTVTLFDVPANLSVSLGTSTADDLLMTLSLNFEIGATSDYSVNTNFTYSGQRQSSYGEAILSKQGRADSTLSKVTVSAGGGEDFMRLGANADFQLDRASAYLGGFTYRDNKQGSIGGSYYGRVNGNMYFSGNNYAFDRSGASSGVIVQMDTLPGSQVEVRADVSGGNSIELKESNTLVDVQSFSESSMYINSSNAVIDNYKHNYVLYKGNFAFLTIAPRQTFEAAGYIDFSDILGDTVTLKNHESKITVKNHESSADVHGVDSEEYFQLTVSRQYPVIELFDGEGQALCTVELDDNLKASTRGDFVYLGEIACQGG